MKYSHQTWIVISGLIWLAVGILLLIKGLIFTVNAVILSQTSSPFWEGVVRLTGSAEQAALFLISLGLLVGFIKGRYILVRTVRRITGRIRTLETPLHWKKIYPQSYYILLSSMMLLGLIFKWLPIEPALKGFIDVAIGSALINGALLYFKEALSLQKHEKS